MAERDRLRLELEALVGWIQEDCDALMMLQQIYSDPTVDPTNRIRAAGMAIGYERPKPPASSLLVVDFAERVRNARLKANAELKARFAAEARTIEHQPSILGSDNGAEGPPAA
jgi:hypothetical protein